MTAWKTYLVPALFIAMVVLFFVGRWTAPEPENPRDKAEIEQLQRDKANAWKLIDQAVDSMQWYKAMSKYYADKAAVSEKAKVLNKKQYETSIHRIDAYATDQLDSALLARYPDSLYRKAP